MRDKSAVLRMVEITQEIKKTNTLMKRIRENFDWHRKIFIDFVVVKKTTTKINKYHVEKEEVDW